jgi:hypothetical protein
MAAELMNSLEATKIGALVSVSDAAAGDEDERMR